MTAPEREKGSRNYAEAMARQCTCGHPLASHRYWGNSTQSECGDENGRCPCSRFRSA